METAAGNVYFDSDDQNPLVNPGMPEICNEIDDDSDGLVDEGVLNTYYFDGDLDTYGHPDGPTIQACTTPEGYASNNADCDDTNANVNPAHPEVCNGLDDNCDGQVDNTWYLSCIIQTSMAMAMEIPHYMSTCDGPPVGMCSMMMIVTMKMSIPIRVPRKFVTISITIVTG
ncbi:MAG: putative metal-binding motif-containing protein [Saprospiraceae bacterium]|nr:putative metal-binding motif-containing protein [Saprospiraceae bacterium]